MSAGMIPDQPPASLVARIRSEFIDAMVDEWIATFRRELSRGRLGDLPELEPVIARVYATGIASGAAIVGAKVEGARPECEAVRAKCREFMEGLDDGG